MTITTIIIIFTICLVLAGLHIGVVNIIMDYVDKGDKNGNKKNNQI